MNHLFSLSSVLSTILALFLFFGINSCAPEVPCFDEINNQFVLVHFLDIPKTIDSCDQIIIDELRAEGLENVEEVIEDFGCYHFKDIYGIGASNNIFVPNTHPQEITLQLNLNADSAAFVFPSTRNQDTLIISYTTAIRDAGTENTCDNEAIYFENIQPKYSTFQEINLSESSFDGRIVFEVVIGLE